MVRPGEDGLRYFIADIELAPGFKKAPEVVTASISYTLEGRRPRFSQVEVDRVEVAVRPGAPGKVPRNVRGGLEVDIVQDHRDPVAAEHHVLLDKVRAHGMRGRLGGQRVFGQVAACTAVGDYNGSIPGECRVCRLGRHPFSTRKKRKRANHSENHTHPLFLLSQFLSHLCFPKGSRKSISRV